MSQNPYDETTARAGDEVQQHGDHAVTEVLRPVAEGPRMKLYAIEDSIRMEGGQVIKILELVDDVEEPGLGKSPEADSIERFIELRASVKWLYEFKYSLLHAVETYKLLLACHLLLLLATIAVLVAMARA